MALMKHFRPFSAPGDENRYWKATKIDTETRHLPSAAVQTELSQPFSQPLPFTPNTHSKRPSHCLSDYIMKIGKVKKSFGEKWKEKLKSDGYSVFFWKFVPWIFFFSVRFRISSVFFSAKTSTQLPDKPKKKAAWTFFILPFWNWTRHDHQVQKSASYGLRMRAELLDVYRITRPLDQ